MKKYISIAFLTLFVNLLMASVALEIQNVDTDAGTLDVYMINDEPVGGFQFELFNITITDATIPTGFLVSTTSSMVLGFSLTGATIPVGEGVLTQVSFTDYAGDEICFGTDPDNNVISDPSGNEAPAEWGECYCTVEFDECGVCGGYGIPEGACDCDGNVVDECGECGGPGPEIECWEGSFVCDEVDCPAPFNPVISLSLSNLNAGEFTDITYSLTQDFGESYLANGSVTSSDGSFDFSTFEVGGSVGSGFIDFIDGTDTTETNLEYQVEVAQLMSDSLINLFTRITGSNNDNFPIDMVIGGYVIENLSSGISVYTESPEEYEISNYYTASITLSGLFVVPEASTLSFEVELTSVAGNIINEVFTFAPVIYGCTDESACNYNGDADEDDGSCEYPEEYYDCDGNCINDSDGDGICDELEVDPDIEVNPTEISAELVYGDSSLQILTISNVGGNVLDWSLEIENVASNSDSRNVGDVLNSFSGLTYYNRGMVWVEDILYVVYDSYNLYTYTIENNALVFQNSIYCDGMVHGLVWDGQYLWTGDHSGYIRAYNLDGTSAGMSFYSPVNDRNAIAFDGEYFIVHDWNYNNPTIYRIDYEGNIIESFNSNINNWDAYQSVWVPEHYDGHLWVTTQNYSVMQLSLENGSAEIVQEFPLPVNDIFYSITHDGTDLWIGHFYGNLYQIDDGISEEPWLTVDIASGSMPADSSQSIQIGLYTENLLDGEYSSVISIFSNDPDESLTIIPASLSVDGFPIITVDADTLDFGLQYTEITDMLTISNEGSDDLSVYSISSDHADFTLDGSPFTINPGSSTEIEITYSPSSLGLHEGALTIYSSDDSTAYTYVSLTGTGITVPSIGSVSPLAISDSLASGELSTHSLQFTNDGEGDLNWHISFNNIDQEAARDTGDVIASFEGLPGYTNGMVWVDDALYVIDREGNSLSKYHIENNVLIEESYSSLFTTSHGMTYDGEYLWIVDYSGGEIRAYTLDGVYTDMYIQSPVSDENAISFDGEYFIVNDWNNNNPTIYRIDYDGNTIASYYSTTSTSIRETVWVSSHSDGQLWGVDVNYYDIVQLSLQNDGTIQVVQRIGQPETNGYAICHDGTDLWYKAYYGDLYQIDDGITEGPFSSDPSSGTLEFGDIQMVDVIFDATEQIASDYLADLLLRNTFNGSTVTVSLSLEVSGIPEISVEPESINLGNVYVGNSGSGSFTVTNIGTDALDVESIETDDPSHFEVIVSDTSYATSGDHTAPTESRNDPFSLVPGESRNVDVHFSPSDAADYSTTLTIVSNGSSGDAFVTVVGTGLYPPEISSDPTSISNWGVFMGDSASTIITLSNSGGDTLHWNAYMLDFGRDENSYTYTFTNCEQEGRFGPSQEQCNAAYASTTLEGNVTINEGIQEWVVPHSGIYTIEVFGAQGGTYSTYEGGKGALMKGTYFLNAGQILTILVGQQGIGGANSQSHYSGGGGGGTFISTYETLLAAAGGGGGCFYYNSSWSNNGYDGVISTAGTSGEGGIAGGTDGNGGACTNGGCSAGYSGDGSTGAVSFLNGGDGGDMLQSWGNYGLVGGFGGGAGAGLPSGGGGGYSGGGGGTWNEAGAGGGGGSYNSGENQDNEGGVNEGHGMAVITLSGPNWLSTNPSSGHIAPGETSDITITVDATELEAGDYSAALTISSNDQSDPEFTVPISITAIDGDLIPPDEFVFNQSTEQAFYYFGEVTDPGGSPISPSDWVGAFNGDICVGFRQWNTSLCSNGICEVTAMGDDGTEHTVGYMQTGDIPTFKVWDTSEGVMYTAMPSEDVAWQSMGSYFIDNMITAINYTMEISLLGGNNLISFYALPSDASIENVMSDIEGNAVGVIGENEAAYYLYEQWIGSLTELSQSSGYWVRVEDIDTLSFEGSYANPGRVYDLHSGSNLISFPSPGSVGVSAGLPDDMEGSVLAIMSQNQGTMWLDGIGWIGGLTHFEGLEGYWFIVDSDLSFSYNLEGLSRMARQAYVETLPAYFHYSHSSNQAFYFVQDVILEDGNVQEGDWVMSYCGERLSGIRQWNGEYMDIPVMGTDGTDKTAGYCSVGDVPSFTLLTQDGETINLIGEDLPKWSNQGAYYIGSLMAAPPIPEVYSLSQAYPNPFNPVTTLEFGVPVDGDVAIDIYNIQGRLVETLRDRHMEAGYHTVVWNADSHSSGMYFVQMRASEYLKTQKIMLVK